MTETERLGVGTLTTGVTAEVDADGTIHRGPVRVGWRVRSGNDWLTPGVDVPARRSRPAAAPVVETAVRLPGGDAVQRVFAVGDGDGDAVVVEVENDSPEAIAVGFVVDAAGAVTGDDTRARVDGSVVAAFTRRPGAVEEDGNVFVFPGPAPHERPHRAHRQRPVWTSARSPPADAVARGLGPRARPGDAHRAARTAAVGGGRGARRLLLAPPSAGAFVVARGLGLRSRGGRDVGAARDAGATRAGVPGAGRGRARRDRAPRSCARTRAAVDILPGFRTAWLGQHLAAHDVPLRARPMLVRACAGTDRVPRSSGTCRPARPCAAPALDPGWSSHEPAGETLLAEPPTALLPLGARAEGAPPGTGIDAPEEFS